ncbi:uncharacterized protein LOC133534496 [Cydia pomonella]|uniref:uncharacterized protein LOC133534496 n=1 Tax=Cydia pomonella TaxID=82600 RepID=UPI002ADD3670|nr:uncharacterized protein LOC133534496 [Cydia pomonella]XP_061729634.1 uncharacterized protein LOC133534496 [Cydia pomonella]
MWKHALSVALGGILCSSLLAFDHILGNGFTDMMQTMFCKCFCFVKRTLRDQLKSSEAVESSNFSATMFLVEIIALLCTMLLLNRYKKYGIERSIKVHKEPNELPGTKKRKPVSRSIDYGPRELNNPQLIKPLNLEVPLMQMAIIDTIGTTRSQPERGDAGDIYNITDSAILSVTSLLDTDFKLQEAIFEDNMVLGDGNTIQLNNNRYLWDVIEEE